MEPKIHPKKILDGHRKSFYHMLRALIALHDQIDHMVIPYLEQSEYITQAHKSHLQNWLQSLHKHHRRYTETIDEGFSILDSYFDFDGDNL